MKFRDLLLKALSEKFEKNSLDDEATENAVAEGVTSVVDMIKSKIQDEDNGPVYVRELLTGGEMKSNPVFLETKEVVAEVLQNNGMVAKEAMAEAAAIAPQLINKLVDRIESTAPIDSQINLENIFKLVPEGKNILDDLKEETT